MGPQLVSQVVGVSLTVGTTMSGARMARRRWLGAVDGISCKIAPVRRWSTRCSSGFPPGQRRQPRRWSSGRSGWFLTASVGGANVSLAARGLTQRIRFHMLPSLVLCAVARAAERLLTDQGAWLHYRARALGKSTTVANIVRPSSAAYAFSSRPSCDRARALPLHGGRVAAPSFGDELFRLLDQGPGRCGRTRP